MTAPGRDRKRLTPVLAALIAICWSSSVVYGDGDEETPKILSSAVEKKVTPEGDTIATLVLTVENPTAFVNVDFRFGRSGGDVYSEKEIKGPGADVKKVKPGVWELRIEQKISRWERTDDYYFRKIFVSDMLRGNGWLSTDVQAVRHENAQKADTPEIESLTITPVENGIFDIEIVAHSNAPMRAFHLKHVDSLHRSQYFSSDHEDFKETSPGVWKLKRVLDTSRTGINPDLIPHAFGDIVVENEGRKSVGYGKKIAFPAKTDALTRVRAIETAYCRAYMDDRPRNLTKEELTDLATGYVHLYRLKGAEELTGSQVMISHFARTEGKFQDWFPVLDSIPYRTEGNQGIALVHLFLSPTADSFFGEKPDPEQEGLATTLLDAAMERDDAALNEMYRAAATGKLRKSYQAMAEAAFKQRSIPMPNSGDEAQRYLAALPLLEPRNDIKPYCKKLLLANPVVVTPQGDSAPEVQKEREVKRVAPETLPGDTPYMTEPSSADEPRTHGRDR